MYYGFDIGGIKIALGMFDDDRQLQWGEWVPTPRDSYGAFLDAVYGPVAEANRRSGCKGSAGIDIPGMPEAEDGTLYAANAPAASGKPLRVDPSTHFDRDVCPDNDANCFALSEAWDDKFVQYPLVMGLIPGTGIGGGLTFSGKPITGKNCITGEFGHVRLPVDTLTMMGLDFPLRRCGCGQHGCVESYLSGRGFVWLYQYYYRQPLQAPEIIALYDQGDEQVGVHVKCYLGLLAVCLGNILTIVNPDLIVIGGDLLNFPAVTMQLTDRLPRRPLSVARAPRIERAHHGDAEGICGAALLHLAD